MFPEVLHRSLTVVKLLIDRSTSFCDNPLTDKGVLGSLQNRVSIRAFDVVLVERLPCSILCRREEMKQGFIRLLSSLFKVDLDDVAVLQYLPVTHLVKLVQVLIHEVTPFGEDW